MRCQGFFLSKPLYSLGGECWCGIDVFNKLLCSDTWNAQTPWRKACMNTRCFQQLNSCSQTLLLWLEKMLHYSDLIDGQIWWEPHEHVSASAFCFNIYMQIISACQFPSHTLLHGHLEQTRTYLKIWLHIKCTWSLYIIKRDFQFLNPNLYYKYLLTCSLLL